MSSQKQIAANRANSQRSTGPRTEAGKAIARANALKHGFCAIVVDIPNENPEVLAQREAEWQQQFNPLGQPFQGYLIHRAIIRSAKLDRIDTVYDCTIASLARDAHKQLKEERLREVEEMDRILPEDPDIAVRRLKCIPEGCDYLIREFNCFFEALDVIDPSWDLSDLRSLAKLTGRRSEQVLNDVPTPGFILTNHMDLHRAVVEKLRINRNPDWILWNLRYKSQEQHQQDKDRLGDLAEKSEYARTHFVDLINHEIGKIQIIKTRLVEEDAISHAEISFKRRFDGTDQGKLMHRYSSDHEKGMIKLINEVVTLNKMEAKMTQDDGNTNVTSHQQADGQPTNQAASIRNEANFPPASSPNYHAPDRPESDKPSATSNLNPERASKNQR